MVTALAGEGKGYSPLVLYPQTRFLLLEVAKGKIHITSEMSLQKLGCKIQPQAWIPLKMWAGREENAHLFRRRRALVACQSVRLTPLPQKASAVERSLTVFCKVIAYYNVIVQPSWRRAVKLFRLLMN